MSTSNSVRAAPKAITALSYAATLGGAGVVLGPPVGVSLFFLHPQAFFGQLHALGAQTVAALLLTRRRFEELAQAAVDLLQAVLEAT